MAKRPVGVRQTAFDFVARPLDTATTHDSVKAQLTTKDAEAVKKAITPECRSGIAKSASAKAENIAVDNEDWALTEEEAKAWESNIYAKIVSGDFKKLP